MKLLLLLLVALTTAHGAVDLKSNSLANNPNTLQPTTDQQQQQQQQSKMMQQPLQSPTPPPVQQQQGTGALDAEFNREVLGQGTEQPSVQGVEHNNALKPENTEHFAVTMYGLYCGQYPGGAQPEMSVTSNPAICTAEGKSVFDNLISEHGAELSQETAEVRTNAAKKEADEPNDARESTEAGSDSSGSGSSTGSTSDQQLQKQTPTTAPTQQQQQTQEQQKQEQQTQQEILATAFLEAESPIHPAGAGNSSRWPTRWIPFCLDNQWTAVERLKILWGVARIARHSRAKPYLVACDAHGHKVKFVKVAAGSRPWSYIGPSNNGFYFASQANIITGIRAWWAGTASTFQPIEFTFSGYSTFTVTHEFMHAIGVEHTHQRSDRNNYLTPGNPGAANWVVLAHANTPAVWPWESLMLYPTTPVEPYVVLPSNAAVHPFTGNPANAGQRTHWDAADAASIAALV